MATAILIWKYEQYFQEKYSAAELKFTIDAFPDLVKNSTFGRDLQRNIVKKVSLSPGGLTPDFTMHTPDGKPVKLSDYVKGKKAVLIDFWASWCGPCRAKNPEVLKVYNQFQQQGFDVLGVSLDDKVDDWKKAIAEDKLPWGQVPDLKGWKSDICKTYDFMGIPTLVLVDGNMRVLAKSSELHKNLGEVVAKFFQ